MADTINYGQLMQHAMRTLMADLLDSVGKNGLPGDHHFYICFDTRHKDVEMADWLRDRYPDDITIVIQHWFENLNVYSDYFTITLNFNDSPESLVVPFEAIKTFVDPTVEFGLRFDDHDETFLEEPAESPMIVIDDDADTDDTPKKDAEIVSLDMFRK